METLGKAESPSSSKDFSCQVQEKVEERPSSPTDCAICLEHLTDKSFTNSCLHMFCFHCLVAWSKIKPECPLCKQDFSSIIHNIRSMTDYDEYHVPPPEARLSVFVNPTITPNPVFARDPRDFFTNNRSFFSYRTTIMSGAYRLPRGRPDNLLIQPYVDNLEIQADFSRMNSNPSAYSRYNRKEIYLKELETLPPPSAGRYRECAPDFYRENEGQIHRLGRWLQRELSALSQIVTRFNAQQLLSLIMDMLPMYHINSTTFFNTINPYLGQHSARFIREFHRFATSPFEMEQYDRTCLFVRQRTGSQLSFIVTVGRDDSEDVQIIPNASNHSFRPWIDVNDLGRAHPSTSTSDATSQFSSGRSSCFGILSNRQRSHSAQTDQPSTSSASQSIINISDSENDDCVIIDQIRSPHETIILDDSEDEMSDVKIVSPFKSATKSRSEGLHSPSTSHQFTESVHHPTTSTSPVDQAMTVKDECDEEIGEVQEKNQASIPSAPQHDTPSHDSSIMSTDPSSNENSFDKCNRKLKRKRSKKYYRVRDIKRKHTSRNYNVCDSSDELIMLTESSDVETDQNDTDWEENFTRKLNMKKMERFLAARKRRTTTRSSSKKTKYVDELQNTPKSCCVEEARLSKTLPRLRSVAKKLENRPILRSHRTKKTSNSGTVCSCNDLIQFQNEPCTSQGIRNLHHETCQFYLMTPVSRNTYSSDSD